MAQAADDDDRLLARHLGGDPAAFEILVGRYAPLVFNACRRVLSDAHDAEDAAQAVFTLLAAKARSLRGRRSLGGWLHRASRNVSSDLRAARRVRRTVTLSEDLAMAPTADNDADERWRSVAPILDDEIAALPEKYRAPLVLHHLEGKSQDDAARVLGWKLGTLSGRLSRARELLRARLERRGVAVALPLLATLLAERTSDAAVPPAVMTAAVSAGKTTALAGALSTATAAWIAGPVLAATIAVTAIVEGRSPPTAGNNVFAFDFEDGRRPTWLRDGDLVRGPERPGSRRCVAGTATDHGGSFGHGVAFDAPHAPLFTYVPGMRLRFDCWYSGTREGLVVYSWDAAAKQSYFVALQHVATGRWVHLDIPLEELHAKDGDRPLVAGDEMFGLAFGCEGSRDDALYIDDLVLSRP